MAVSVNGNSHQKDVQRMVRGTASVGGGSFLLLQFLQGLSLIHILPLFAYAAMGGATWLSTILPSAGIGMQNNFLYQLANFNYLHLGGMSFWTPYRCV